MEQIIMTEKQKTCFVVSPIGEAESDIRKNADKVLEHIIRPSAEFFDYVVVRADEIKSPGSITADMFEHLFNDELVIADLTRYNPNVFYEVAVRHAVDLPIILLIKEGEGIPFDLYDLRIIKYDFDIAKAKKATEDIKGQIEAIETSSENGAFGNPLKRAILQTALLESSDSMQQAIGELLDGISKARQEIAEIQDKLPAQTEREVRKKLISILSKRLISLNDDIEEKEKELEDYGDQEIEEDKEQYEYLKWELEELEQTHDNVLSTLIHLRHQ